MKTYRVSYVRFPNQGSEQAAEGSVDVSCLFQDVPALEISEPAWITEEARKAETAPGALPLGIRGAAQLLWNEEAFYVHLSAVEKAIRAEERGPLGMPCEDSCLEFFFAPCPPDRRYFNLEFNPNGCLYLGIGSSIEDLTRLLPEGGTEALFCPAVKRTVAGWEIFYRVPFSFVRRFFTDFEPEHGLRLRANFYKCGDLTVRPHFLSWNPVTVVPVSFHRPDDFGEIVLE